MSHRVAHVPPKKKSVVAEAILFELPAQRLSFLVIGKLLVQTGAVSFRYKLNFLSKEHIAHRIEFVFA